MFSHSDTLEYAEICNALEYISQKVKVEKDLMFLTFKEYFENKNKKNMHISQAHENCETKNMEKNETGNKTRIWT